jgi:hypothetical protein
VIKLTVIDVMMNKLTVVAIHENSGCLSYKILIKGTVEGFSNRSALHNGRYQRDAAVAKVCDYASNSVPSKGHNIIFVFIGVFMLRNGAQ